MALRRGPLAHAGTRSPSSPPRPTSTPLVAYGVRGSDALPRPGPQGRRGRRPGLRAAIGSARCGSTSRRTSRASTSARADALRSAPSSSPPRRTARRARASSPTAPRRATTRCAWRWRRSAPPSSCSATRTRRVIDGLVLSGGAPTFVAPEYDAELGMAHGVTPGVARRGARARAGRARRVHRLADLLRDGRRRGGLRRGLPRRWRAARRRPGLGPALRLPPGAAAVARSRSAPTPCSPPRTRSSARSRSRRCCTSPRPAGSTPTRSRARCGWCAPPRSRRC